MALLNPKTRLNAYLRVIGFADYQAEPERASVARQRGKAGPPAQTSAEVQAAPQNECLTASDKRAGIKGSATGKNQKKQKARRARLHGDGVVGVANHVPARTVAGVGKDRVAAGDVLFGMNGVDFVFGFVAFRRDSKKTDAMNGTCGLT